MLALLIGTVLYLQLCVLLLLVSEHLSLPYLTLYRLNN